MRVTTISNISLALKMSKGPEYDLTQPLRRFTLCSHDGLRQLILSGGVMHEIFSQQVHSYAVDTKSWNRLPDMVE